MELLHQSTYYKLYQCDLKRCFCFKTAHKSVHLSFCQLLNLRDQVRTINIEDHFYDDRNHAGIEILCLCNREHLIILDTKQVIDLKRFIESVFVLMQSQEALESIV